MGKKDKDPTPNPANIPNKDIIQRLNFLYQASVYLTNLVHNVPPSTSPDVVNDDEGEQENKQQEDNNQVRNREQKNNRNRNLKPKLNKSESKQARRVLRLRTRTTDELARAYVHTMATVGKKTLVKMDPSIKRTICKSCKAVLIPGVSVQVRVKRSSSHRHALVLKCTGCGYARRLPAPGRKGWNGRGRWDAEDAEDTGNGGDERDEGDERDRLGPSESSANQKEQDEGEEVSKNENENKNKEKKKGKGKGKSCRVYPPLALSARRDAGHVVFRGTERVDDVLRMDEVDEVGDGVFAV